jgi:exodeoxyribonuclease-3
MEFEERMTNYLKNLDKIKPVIYAGDLNVAHKEIDLKNPKANVMNPGFTLEERNAFSELLSNNFIDTYRYKYPNAVKYTWWSYRFNARANNAGWRIDYFVVSDRIKDLIEDSLIHNEIMGSDHCPISLIIKI